MKQEDFSAEELEQQDGYFANQAQSEFRRIIEREKYNNRKGKLTFLRGIGRKERLSLNRKHGRRWQDTV